MKKRTLTALTALLLVCSLMLTACGGSSSTASSVPASSTVTTGIPEAVANTEKSDETLTVMLNAEPDTMLAGVMNEGACIVQNTFAESILRYDPETKGCLCLPYAPHPEFGPAGRHMARRAGRSLQAVGFF